MPYVFCVFFFVTRSWIPESYCDFVPNVLRNHQNIFWAPKSFYISTTSVWRSQFFYVLINTCYYLSFWWMTLVGVKWYLIVFFWKSFTDKWSIFHTFRKGTFQWFLVSPVNFRTLFHPKRNSELIDYHCQIPSPLSSLRYPLIYILSQYICLSRYFI